MKSTLHKDGVVPEELKDNQESCEFEQESAILEYESDIENVDSNSNDEDHGINVESDFMRESKKRSSEKNFKNKKNHEIDFDNRKTKVEIDKCKNVNQNETLESIPLFDPKLLERYLQKLNLRKYGFNSPVSDDGPDSNNDGDFENLFNLEDQKKIEEDRLENFLSIAKYLTGVDEVKNSKFSCFSNIPFDNNPKKSNYNTDPLINESNHLKNTPYKGRHGSNPSCASCKTTKTPYWRDSWNQGFIMCNACGLRYSKFKRRCGTCFYVPRKDDKGGKNCIKCNGFWVQ